MTASVHLRFRAAAATQISKKRTATTQLAGTAVTNGVTSFNVFLHGLFMDFPVQSSQVC